MRSINIKLHTKGETIMETIIAMGILAIGIMISGTIIASSLRNMNASKNRVIAVNLAREGIEAMINIRDTNWLKFSSRKRECWNHDPKTDTCIGSSESIQPSDYIIYKQATVGGWKWRLENVVKSVTTQPASPSKYQTYSSSGTAFIYDGTNWVDLKNLSIVEDGSYNHALVSEGNALGEANAKTTVFKRWLTIGYLADDGNTSPAATNRMRITSNISWNEGKNVFTTSLTTDLTDYFGRESLIN